MPKKKKKFNKLKKRHQSQPYQGVRATKIVTEQKDDNLDEQISSLSSESEGEIEESVSKDIPASIENEYAYVKGDIKKILLIFFSIIVFLIAIYIVDIKTTLLSSFGDWIYKILNIQTS